MGRPSKLTDEFLETAQHVLTEGDSCIIFTDEELVAEINDRLPEQARITNTTFESWKRGNLKDERLDRFITLYKKVERIQKRNLFKGMKEAKPGDWQKYAWIIERKYPVWNLKSVQEHKITVDPIKIIIILDD